MMTAWNSTIDQGGPIWKAGLLSAMSSPNLLEPSEVIELAIRMHVIETAWFNVVSELP
jgi:hypothetical protein